MTRADHQTRRVYERRAEEISAGFSSEDADFTGKFYANFSPALLFQKNVYCSFFFFFKERKVFRRIFGPRLDEIPGERRIRENEELRQPCQTPDVIGESEKRGLRGQDTRGEKRKRLCGRFDVGCRTERDHWRSPTGHDWDGRPSEEGYWNGRIGFWLACFGEGQKVRIACITVRYNWSNTK